MADPISNPIVQYFIPHAYGHWQWDLEEPYLKWIRGGTICHRNDLEQILTSLQPMGWPELEVLLSLIEALKPEPDEEFWKIMGLNPGEKKAPYESSIEWMVALPAKLKSGQERIMVLHKLVGLVPRVLMPGEALNLLDRFVSGALDSQILKPRVVRLDDVPRVDQAFRAIFQAFDSFDAFLVFMQVGLEESPKPIDEIEFPVIEEETLLETLEQDGQTSGLAALTKHLLAAFNIPMQLRGANDMPLGGVSDITNKGALDRLLLSELANDDLTLSARLANNEALYLRREEPPAKIDKSRIVLIDTTLRMWGMSRAFAVSVALACLVSRPKGSAAESFALNGFGFEPRPLENKEDVIAMLQTLAPELHCADGLKECLTQLARKPMERIFVTTGESLAQPEFAQSLFALQENLDFIIALGRNGEFQLFQIVNGRRKLLKEAKLDIKKLLFTRPKKQSKKAQEGLGEDDFPAFVLQEEAPLFFPAPNSRIKAKNAWKLNDAEKVMLTDDRRMLFWKFPNSAAMELFRDIEQGVIFLEGTTNEGVSFLIDTKEAGLGNLVYHYDLETRKGKRVELPEEYQQFHGVWYLKNRFSWQHRAKDSEWETIIFDCITEEIQVLPRNDRMIEEGWEQVQGPSHKALKGQDKQSLNHGYSPLTSIKSVAIDAEARIYIDGRYLNISQLEADTTFEWKVGGKDAGKRSFYIRIPSGPLMPLPEGNTRYLRYAHTPDGTQICLDRRGFLHLKSSDPALPEVTIVTITEKPTAAWASDGKYTGSHYFLGRHYREAISPRIFEHLYLSPIIERILKG